MMVAAEEAAIQPVVYQPVRRAVGRAAHLLRTWMSKWPWRLVGDWNRIRARKLDAQDQIRAATLGRPFGPISIRTEQIAITWNASRSNATRCNSAGALSSWLALPRSRKLATCCCCCCSVTMGPPLDNDGSCCFLGEQQERPCVRSRWP